MVIWVEMAMAEMSCLSVLRPVKSFAPDYLFEIQNFDTSSEAGKQFFDVGRHQLFPFEVLETLAEQILTFPKQLF